ncbi:vegetative cell wall protein gp1 [Blastomyces dermatitidis ATCC 18188]|uniref:Vegetative cell wall protein gp1 n=1 Tax=Ajellomyces dermatitidis (strain ATCC 18188 / CBS 674.68) TaxID=653446 RepID=F2T3P4_AJEDA|nr:vegetative cell wall protein gp1 [Blastomyces dermatitidis ATCC 18188]
MAFFGIQRPQAPNPYGRSNTPTISAPLPFPPSYYMENISTSILNPSLPHSGLVNPDHFQQPPRPAPPRPDVVASQHPQHSAHPAVHQTPPPLEDHPAYRDIHPPMNNSSNIVNGDEKNKNDTHQFISYNPSAYDISRLSILSSQDLPPTPPNSPPILPFCSPTPSQTRFTSTWIPPEQLVQPIPCYESRPKWHQYHHHHLYPPLKDNAPTTSKASARASLYSVTDQDHISSSGSPDLSDLLSGKLDEVITSIGGQEFSGMEQDLHVSYHHPQPPLRGGDSGGGRPFRVRKRRTYLSNINYFSKVYHYANCRLPDTLTPLRLYIPTYPLLCLAARFSQRVYNKPTGAERETRVEADWRLGTKAMVIKSEPVDNMNVIVFAIRGTHSFRDWATNMNSDPVAPDNFLDDRGNLCHAGFLSVARRIAKPVAMRLRQILDENPSRISSSLVITGHSAGGAIASLLYMHMLSETLKSDLIRMRDYFKRVHCITFGAPPVSLLPLQKPVGPGRDRFQKWLFFSFVNEGDPVPRADKAYVRSLVDLYISPAPPLPRSPLTAQGEKESSATARKSTSSLQQKLYRLGGRKPTSDKNKSSKNNNRKSDLDETHDQMPTVVWKTPPSSLCAAGNLILLRGADREKQRNHLLDGGYVEAFLLKDDDLQDVVFGDPMMHVMELYEQRIEILATNAVTARFSLR